MSFLTMIRKQGTVRGRRWTIRRDKDENITDIKMIFNPDIYATHHNAKKMYGDKALIKILEDEKEKNKR